MKVIVAGSRQIKDREIVGKAMDGAPFGIETLMHGGAKGVDKTAAKLTKLDRFKDIEVQEYKAKWGVYGDAAGPKRNRAMAEEADALIAIWDGESRGTRNMIQEAIKQNLDIYVRNINDGKPDAGQKTITDSMKNTTELSEE